MNRYIVVLKDVFTFHLKQFFLTLDILQCNRRKGSGRKRVSTSKKKKPKWQTDGPNRRLNENELTLRSFLLYFLKHFLFIFIILLLSLYIIQVNVFNLFGTERNHLFSFLNTYDTIRYIHMYVWMNSNLNSTNITLNYTFNDIRQDINWI